MKRVDPSSSEVERGFKLLNGAKIRFPQSPLEIKLYYDRHGNNNVLDDSFFEDLRQTDIFCFESIGWEPWHLHLTQRVADGDNAALAEVNHHWDVSHFPNQAEFGRRIYKELFGTKVKVHFPDVPKNHTYMKELFNSTKPAAQLLLEIERGNEFFVSDVSLLEAASNLMRVSIKRDKYVLEHFLPKVEAKPVIRVLGFFGLMHSGTAISLVREASKQQRDDVVVESNRLPESPAFIKFLDKQPVSREELIDLLRYWGDS